MHSTIAATCGSTCRLRRSSDTFASWLATNRFAPSGGVRNATSFVTTKRIPKWIGSMPSWTTTGSRTGVTMMIVDRVSMNMPRTKNARMMMSRIVNGSVEMVVRSPASFWGAWFTVRIWPNTVEVATMIMAVEMRAASIRESKIERRVSIRLTAPPTRSP